MNLRLPALGLVVAAVLGLADLAQGPLRRPIVVPPLSSYQSRVNPNYYLAPGLTVNQYAYNVATIGRAYQQIPPYMYGYNPYPQAVFTGPQYSSPTPFVPYSPYANPYTANPYTSVYPNYFGPFNLYGNYPGTRLP